MGWSERLEISTVLSYFTARAWSSLSWIRLDRMDRIKSKRTNGRKAYISAFDPF
jgi:hypothetical protein